MNKLPSHTLKQLSTKIEEIMGLSFPFKKWSDLEKAMSRIQVSFEHETLKDCAEWFLESKLDKESIKKIAAHLTIGETYFFRDPQQFKLLRMKLIPEILQHKESGERHLRFWSAGCASGEEAYSMAIIAEQLQFTQRDVHISILGTDINVESLRKAEKAIYREWSFRGMPSEIKRYYFAPLDDQHYQVVPKIRRRVKFEFLNLAEKTYPTLQSETNAIDILMCRNVLMYFTREQQKNIVQRFHNALSDNGVLFVSPCEVDEELFQQFQMVVEPNVIYFRKSPVQATAQPIHTFDHTTFSSSPATISSKDISYQSTLQKETVYPTDHATSGNDFSWRMVSKLIEEGQSQDALHILGQLPVQEQNTAQALLYRAQALANQGELQHALSSIEESVKVNKIDPKAHYIHAMILIELERYSEAKDALQRTLFLDHDMILPYMNLGNIAKQVGEKALAIKQYKTALTLLEKLDPDHQIEGTQGLTAEQLMEMIRSMLEMIGEQEEAK